MTKSQKKIYDWLIEHPGYLKKSAKSICDITTGCMEKEVKEVLIQARIDHKLGVSVSIINPKKTKNVVKLSGKQVNSNRMASGTYYITGCAHAPWQNKAMYDVVFKYLNQEVDLEGLILAGDIVDLNSLSSHDKGKVPLKGVTLSWEYQEANKFLDEFDELNIKGTKDYIFGNHEDRYIRSTKDVDTAKLGSALLSPIEGLKLEERGYNVYKDWKNDAIHLGTHLDICHGEFLNIHSAKKTIDTYRKSVLYFHTHRFQIYVEGLVGGWNMGFGGDINSSIFNYATRAMKNSWVNSSCLVTLDKDGYYHVEPLMFINNKLIVNGKQY